jgi:hypothetical protein
MRERERKREREIMALLVMQAGGMDRISAWKTSRRPVRIVFGCIRRSPPGRRVCAGMEDEQAACHCVTLRQETSRQAC